MVLAHAHPGALAEQVADLRLVEPGCRVSVFNGGPDRELTSGLDVDVVPTSRPLRHGFLALFHALTLEWCDPGERVVTLDSDAWVVRPFSDVDASYAAPHLSEVRPGTPWGPGRRFLPAWSQWQQVLPIEHPLRCFNPVQVFGPEYVERFRRWPRRPELLARLAASRLEALEEIVWPSLAAALDLQPAALDGDGALQLERHAPWALQTHLQDPHVRVLHKIGLEPGARDRSLVRAWLRGEQPSFDVPDDYRAPGRGRSAIGVRAKDLLFRVQRRA